MPEHSHWTQLCFVDCSGGGREAREETTVLLTTRGSMDKCTTVLQEDDLRTCLPITGTTQQEDPGRT